MPISQELRAILVCPQCKGELRDQKEPECLICDRCGLAYAITAGILEWVFVKDGTSGGQLVVLTLSLVVYAVHVPLLIGFTVARYESDIWTMELKKQ